MVENYHISKSSYGIVELLINTQEKWVDFTIVTGLVKGVMSFGVWFYNEDHSDFVEQFDIPESELQLDPEERYLKIHQQEKDQITFYWIPLRLTKGDEYMERFKKLKQKK